MATGQTTLDSNVYVAGNLACQSLSAPAGSIGNTAIVAGSSGNYVTYTKLGQLFEVVFSQEGGTDSAAEVRVIHVVRGAAAVLVAFHAGSVVAATSTGAATLDLKKNGTTVLTAVITLDSANTAYVVESAAGFTSTALVAGDVLSVTVATSGSPKPKGVFARLVLSEDPQ